MCSTRNLEDFVIKQPMRNLWKNIARAWVLWMCFETCASTIQWVAWSFPECDNVLRRVGDSVNVFDRPVGCVVIHYIQTHVCDYPLAAQRSFSSFLHLYKFETNMLYLDLEFFMGQLAQHTAGLLKLWHEPTNGGAFALLHDRILHLRITWVISSMEGNALWPSPCSARDRSVKLCNSIVLGHSRRMISISWPDRLINVLLASSRVGRKIVLVILLLQADSSCRTGNAAIWLLCKHRRQWIIASRWAQRRKDSRKTEKMNLLNPVCGARTVQLHVWV